jgi:alkyldihydroxyacetonephosphate synthase
MVTAMSTMKWWGWGPEGVEFTHADKPDLAPFIEKVLGLNVGAPTAPPPRFDELAVPPSRLPDDLREALETAVTPAFVSIDPQDRVVHGRGKSVRDLILQRRGDLGRVVDAVLRPADEQQVTEILRAAVSFDAVVIPFGGGSSISGSLEPALEEPRPILSIDLTRLDRVLQIDHVSRLARVQAGVMGPALEAQLGAAGYTMGHLPDSFPHSTLGGWIATRSSGMQSDRYGDVADLTKGLRVVTPWGTLVVRPLPATSSGPSVREMVLGSEGRLGIITEATVQVHRLPQQRTILGYLFPTFADGLAAMRDLAADGCPVSVTRVSDPHETQFSFALRQNPTPLDRVQSWALRQYLRRRRGFDVHAMCLAFIGYEGSPRRVAARRRTVGKIVGAHGGLCIGSGPGALYDRKKFDTPYIRDFLLDRGAIGDVSETAMPWSRMAAVYEAVSAAANEAFDRLKVQGYFMCHLSHSYHAGACLYFTFAFVPSPGGDMTTEYDVVKSAVQQAFVDHGATLSHHHAVGTEHSQWLEQDISAPGVAMLKALFDGTDPGRHLNPGKIV